MISPVHGVLDAADSLVCKKILTGRVPEERQETGDIHFSGFHTLLFPWKEWKIPGEEENQQEEVCKEVHRLIKSMRVKPLKEIMKKLNQILVGYYHYFGITDNIKSLSNFRYRVTKSLYKWLNRRSQKKSYSWERFNDMMKKYPLALPFIYVSVYAR